MIVSPQSLILLPRYRRSILWQDGLLSLRYDRKPIYTQRLSITLPNLAVDLEFDYRSCMNNVIKVTRAWLLCDAQERFDAESIQQRITTLAHVKNNAIGRLREVEQCTSVHQKVEFYALTMHTSFLTSEMCRPFLIKPTTEGQHNQPVSVELHQMGIACLQRTVEAYLSMSQLSILPIRSWSLTHEVFTAVCVLTLLELRRTSDSIDSLLGLFQMFLERELTSESPKEAATYSLLRRGRKLLRILDSSAQRPRVEIAATRSQGLLRNLSGTHVDVEEAPQTMDYPAPVENPLNEFDTLLDSFWESDPFNEPDGTLLSMFDPFHNVS